MFKINKIAFIFAMIAFVLYLWGMWMENLQIMLITIMLLFIFIYLSFSKTNK